MSQLARNRALSMGSGRSSTGRNASLADFSMAQASLVRDFDPCDATASMFLYAQGNSVVVAHHDTLTIERRFSRHTEEVQLLAVDNVSERGAGRLVISYDAGQTAIVWDLMTGDEVARFASYNNLSVAAWMRNGNVAFGNAQGNVILFEPSTSEHISARTIDQIPITALSPAADCRTYAIGYQNGSILICTLQPRFTIIHNLTTSRSPSPIVTLAWHASSSKQKSDMLATQTQDGDLRVWSIAKNHTSNEPAKVVRILKRSERFQPGPNWLGWSKNGRIVQYSEGETSSWDVRTKHVTYENVPTLEHVRGIAIYGPGATLFTLGANNTAQQFDLNSPPVIVANVQHPANLLPPSPPVSIEEQKQGIVTMQADGLSSIPINVDIVSESDDDHMSPLARIAREMDKLEERQQVPDRSGALSPVSSQASFTSRSSAASRPYRKEGSVRSKLSEHTVMSLGSSLHSREPSVVSSRDSFSMSSVSSTHSSRSRTRGSRLRQEVLRSPEEKIIVDLFKFTKSRLSDLPYRAPQVPDGAPKSTADLRRAMLTTIFGWDGEAEGLIRDELSRHPRGSANSLLLTKWLGDLDTDIMATSSQSMTSSDWMLLALSGIGGQASQQKVARAYIQRLLEKGDVHTAATIMIGMGDQNDAIEIYVSHKRYMEALILTCYVYPADWGRQAQLIRKWGEWAVQHSQQALAIRCFSCTGTESSEPYFSPAPQTTTFAQRSSNIPDMLSPPLSPPGVVPRGPQRNMAKQAALKLVTSFGEKNSKAKYFGADGDKTPMNQIGVTPIAESALSPSGGDQTAFIRPSRRDVFHTPATATARTATPGGFARARLPSIGEMPTDVTPVVKKSRAPPSVSSVSEDSSSEYDYPRRSHSRQRSQPDDLRVNTAALQGSRASTASPMMQRTKNERTSNTLPPPSADAFSRTKEQSRLRNGSRDRKPHDLQLQWPPMDDVLSGDYMTTPELSATSSHHRTPLARSVAGSVAGSVSSVSISGRRSPTMSERSYRSGLATPLTGRSLDPYFSSLEAAQQTVKPKNRTRQPSRDPSEIQSRRGRSSSRKPKAREPSEERGRSAVRYVKSGKRSPTSPVPMSPDEFREINYDDDQSETASNSGMATRKPKARDASAATVKMRSRQASRVRRASPEALRINTGSRAESRTRAASRRVSPDPSYARDERGRSKLRDGSSMRSPSSPLPMTPDAMFNKFDRPEGDSDDDLKAAQADQERFKSRHRSVSRVRERGSSAVRHVSPKRREPSRTRLGLAQDEQRDEPKRATRAASQTRVSDLKAGDLQKIKLERQRKKESAAKELEERRRSLTRRPSAPPITHPEELSPMVYRPASRSENKSNGYSPAQLPIRSQTVSPETMRMADASRSTSLQIGLPATPRAMQHPKYDPDNKDIPEVPQIPDNYNSTPQVMMGSLDEIASSDLLPQTTFAPLPKTTYQATPRHIPPRSMSAPIPEEPPLSPQPLPATLPTHPAFQAALPPSTRRRNPEAAADEKSNTQAVRKVNPGESGPGTIGYETRNNTPVYSATPVVMGGIEETLAASTYSNNNMVPPPPPPAPVPPILRELQHLAVPPPPPPAPLYRSGGSSSAPAPAPSAVIEIVMDEEAPVPTRTTPPQEAVGHQSTGHSRGRSQNENTISGRFSRATERMRSASRGPPPQLSRTKSPPVSPPVVAAPYESIPTAKWVLDQMQNRAVYQAAAQQAQTTERHPRDVKADMIEGGMI